MPKRLSASGEAALNSKNVTTCCQLKLNGSNLDDVVEYSYNFDKHFGASSLEITLNNQDGKYGVNGTNEIKLGDVITLKEGLVNTDGIIESFDKFYGIVRHLSPQSDANGSYLKITALDKICKLDDLEIDKLITSSDVAIRYMPDYTEGGVLLMESFVSSKLSEGAAYGATTLYLESVDGFEADVNENSLSWIYIGSVTESHKYELVSINSALKTITIEPGIQEVSGVSAGTYVRQRCSDTASKKGYAFYYDFGYWDYEQSDFPMAWFASGSPTTIYFHPVQNISPVDVPRIIVKYKDTITEIKDPLWNGYEVNYATGQVVLGTPLEVNNWELWANFNYYPVETIQYAEDIIETLLTEPDGYGNTVFTSSDYTTDLDTEDGTSTDALTYNRSPVIINDTTYSIGQVWYHKYSNIITSLVSDDYTIPTGNSISSINLRYGRVILESPVSNPTDGDVTCNTNYSFKTIQATGVKIPFIDFRQDKVKNRMEAFNDLKKQLAPNYIIRSSGDGKIWGLHLRQKVSHDLDIKLIQSLSYESDTEIYTRVKLFGENATPKNVLIDADYTSDGTYTTFASNVPLVWTGERESMYEGWLEFTVPDSLVDESEMGLILSKPKPPVVWINGLRNSTTAIDNVPFESWGYYQDESTYKGFVFNLAIDFNSPIIFFRNGEPYGFEVDGTLYDGINDKVTVNMLSLEWDSENFVYKWNPMSDAHITNKNYWSSDIISQISSITFNLAYNNAWKYAPTDSLPNRFLINPQYLILTEESQGLVDRSKKGCLVNSSNYGLVGPGTVEFKSSTSSTPYALCDGKDYFYTCITGKNFGSIKDVNSQYVYLTIDLEGFSLVRNIEMWYGYIPDCTIGSISDFYWYWWSESQNAWRLLMTDAKVGVTAQVVSDPGEGNGPVFDGYTYKKYRWTCRWTYTDKLQLRISNSSDGKLGRSPSVRYYLPEVYVNCCKETFNVTADFWYRKAFSIPSPDNIRKLHDGLWSTQFQSIYLFEPTDGHRLITFDIKQVYENGQLVYPKIEAIDIVGGWYMPNQNDPTRKYDISNKYSIEYWDGSDWYPVAKDASQFSLGSGETRSFERDDLGNEFRPQKLSIVLNQVGKIEGFGATKYVVSLIEFSAWQNITLTAESKLIRTTKLSQATTNGATTVYVESTDGFPSSGTAYISADGYDINKFTYTSKTSSSFNGCSNVLARPANSYVSISPASSSLDLTNYYNIYDPDLLLDRYGDRLYKDTDVNKYLNTQTKLNSMARLMLKELTKNVTSVSAPVVCRPDVYLGDTVRVYDPINTSGNQNYFVESISSRNGSLNLRLAKYWSIDQEVEI